jgi:hypothetical protein
MPIKRLLCPARVRRAPKQFSWVDQRLVGDHYVERCDACALALYLFRVTVADDQGLSYYSDATPLRAFVDGRSHLEQSAPSADEGAAHRL